MDPTVLWCYYVHKRSELYNDGVIDSLLKNNKKGFKPIKLASEQYKKREEKLNDPENGIRGYKELQ
jgi:hypothetical protein